MKASTLRTSLFFVITLSILILISGLLFYKNLVGIMTAWNQANRMTIYLKIDTSQNEREKLVTWLRQQNHVTATEYVSREQAAVSFRESLKEFSAGLLSEDDFYDLIPETLEVDLSADLNLSEREAGFATLKDDLMKSGALAATVDEIHYGADNLKKFERLDRVIRSVGTLIFFIVLISISYLIALMVRVFIEDSKQEIEVYSLLGATRWSIYRLFLRDIFLFLSASLFLSFTLLFFIFVFVRERLSSSDLASLWSGSLRFLSFGESATVAGLLFLFIYLSSFLTIRSSVSRLTPLSNE